jgi:predicted amidohydrolase YtcJ
MLRLISIVFLMLLVACGGHEADFARSLAVKAPADIVLRRGKIISGDGNFSIYDALAIKDGRFLALGTEREMRPLIAPKTRVIDLAGRTVIPGLIDSYVYGTLAGLTWDRDLHWESNRTLADGLRQIATAAKAKPRGSWIVVGGGWVPTQFAERRFPTRMDLDALAPDHPVYIQYLDEGALVNSAALAALGITARTADPAGGKFERNPQTGELTGWLQGPAAWRLAHAKVPKPSLDTVRESLQHCFRELNRLGITSIGDVQPNGVSFAHRRILADMARAGELPLRMNFYIEAEHAPDEIGQLKGLMEEVKGLHQSDNFKFAGFALSAIENDGNVAGISAGTKDSFRRLAQFFAAEGFNFQVRAGNDLKARQLLDILDQVRAATPFAHHRIIFTDLDDITPETAERIKKLGGGLSVQDRMALVGERSVELWGLERARNAPPLRTLIQSGMPLGAGTGAFQSGNYSPMLSLWWLVTGKTVAGTAIRNQSQNPTRAEALRLYTMGSAWTTFEEGRKGSIEVGKQADLAVLNADYLTVTEEQIRSLQSLLTIVGGRIVYAAGPFEQESRNKNQGRSR